MIGNANAATLTKSEKLARSLARELAASLEEDKLGDDSPAGALARGKVFQAAGYLEEAIESYSGALDSRYADEAAARLAIVRLYAGDADNALETAMALASRNPGFEVKELTSKQRVSALTILGDALAQKGRIDEALDAYERARKTSPRDAFAAGRLAEIYFAKGDTTRAAANARVAAKNPRFTTLTTLVEGGENVSAFAPRISKGLDVSKPGRPLLVDDAPLLAPLVRGDAWCRETNAM
jgi:tetratricopeptide (TPR) repeat protein